MIKPKCFTEEWLDEFKKQKKHVRIDKIILEKMIYALHLLECIQVNGLDFVFKGGTSLLLLLKEGNRFSIDIDIICNQDRKAIEAVLQKVVDNSQFSSYELDAHRSYRLGIPKAHYAFAFDSVSKGNYSGTILLDILIEDSIYPEIIESVIQTKWIDTAKVIFVKTPSIDSITGDKLTAFAPNTIGVPYFKGVQNQSFAKEICKQLFDLSKLFEKISNIETVAKSYYAFAEQEIEYRKPIHKSLELSPKTVLQDTINTCLIITKRGGKTEDEKTKFQELQKGIKAFGTGFLMEGRFRIDDAIAASSRIAYLATKILHNDLTPIIYYSNQDVKELTIKETDWSFVNRLKRQPDKSGFFYWYQTIQLFKDRT